MSEGLKHCPFCGGWNLYFDHSLIQPENLNGGKWVCENCDAEGPDTAYWHNTEQEARLDAAKAWNTRHIPEGYITREQGKKELADAGMIAIPVEIIQKVLDAHRFSSVDFGAMRELEVMIAAAQESGK